MIRSQKCLPRARWVGRGIHWKGYLSLSLHNIGRTQAGWPVHSKGSIDITCLVAQPCLTLCDPMDCSLPASSAHGISQVRMLECVAVSYQGDLSKLGIQPTSPMLVGWFFTTWWMIHQGSLRNELAYYKTFCYNRRRQEKKLLVVDRKHPQT